MTRRSRAYLLLIVIMALAAPAAMAQMSAKEKASQVKKAGETSKKAAKVMDELMRIPASSIPESLLSKAKAIAVFPGVKKVAFGIGGSGGQGLISRRLASGWSAPVAFKLAQGSLGFQIGASSTDYVLLIMNDDGLRHLLGNKFELGGEASVAAGPVGRTGAATTDAELQAEILSYSRSKGLFAGISLKGGAISPDNDRNMALYGFEAKELLTGDNKIAIANIPAATRTFHQSITRAAK
ncbi:MAG TPA: lipid-binding SYLF domain-containing protein [Pyrinomonadaceae bacterium]|nr:lipid-binding SYLF domain-containing protein [Pyrinomonadaceae bacterium]